MSDWEALYKEKGIIQKEPSVFVKGAVKFFKDKNLKKILDLGCGTGRHTIYLLQKGFEVNGCDSSETGLNIAKDVINEVRFDKCDMTALPYDSKFFDGVLCHFVIQHARIKKIKKAINEIYRVLKKGGILYISVPSIEHPDSKTGEEIEKNTKINIDAIDGQIPHHYFSEKEMNALFSNFDILKLEHVEFSSERIPDGKAAAFILYGMK